MFNAKIILSFSIFITFLIITSFIKNQSRILEKKIFGINKKVISNQKNLSETQLEFFYLSSPLEIEKRLNSNDFKNFEPIKHSKIFYSLKDFILIEKKLSGLRNIDEKKIQKK